MNKGSRALNIERLSAEQWPLSAVLFTPPRAHFAKPSYDIIYRWKIEHLTIGGRGRYS